MGSIPIRLRGYPKGQEPVRFARCTGQESAEDRQALAANPPDILLTNYVMLELMLTQHSAPGVKAAQGDFLEGIGRHGHG